MENFENFMQMVMNAVPLSQINDAKEFFNNKKHWLKEEHRILKEETLCLCVTIGNFPYFYTVAHTNGMIEWMSNLNYNIKALAMTGDSRHFLDDKDVICLDSGFWRCNCKTGFLRSSLVLQCPICGCKINESEKQKYIRMML